MRLRPGGLTALPGLVISIAWQQTLVLNDHYKYHVVGLGYRMALGFISACKYGNVRSISLEVGSTNDDSFYGYSIMSNTATTYRQSKIHKSVRVMILVRLLRLSLHRRRHTPSSLRVLSLLLPLGLPPLLHPSLNIVHGLQRPHLVLHQIAL